jgi:hypothetical protein
MTSKIVVNNIEADAGVSTVTFNSNVERGSSNLHSTGLNVNDTFVHSTGISLGAGSTIGAVTGVTTYYGDGSQLTGISAGAISAIASDGANRVLTSDGDGTATAHSFVTIESNRLSVNRGSGSGAFPLIVRRTDASGIIAEFANSSGYGLLIGQNSATGEAYLRTGTGQPLVITTNAGSGIANERLRISSDGYVTKPATPCFDAVRSGGNVSAGNIIHYNTVNVNNGNHYNSSNGRFTAPVAGFYFFSYGTIKNSTNNVTRLHIYKNGSRIYNAGRHLRMDSGQNYGDNGAMTIVVSLAVNDYISIKVEEGEIYGTTQEYCYFNGFLIG